MQLTRFITLALISTAVIACDDDDPVGPPDDTAIVRIINAAPGTSDVDVTASGLTSLLANDLDFRGSTQACAFVPSGSQQTLTFREGNTTLATRQFTFEEDQTYTIVLASDDGDEFVSIFEDDETVAAANRAVRFLNTSAAPGDVYIYSGTTIGDADIEELAVLTSTTGNVAWTTRPAGEVNVRFHAVGDPTTEEPLGELTLQAPTGRRMQYVIFSEAGQPAGATAWTVSACP